MRMRELAVGDVPVRALRVTFVGELGWELYCPTEYGAALWRTLWEAGREHGLRRRAATARSTRCAWRRATACGRPTSPPTRPRYEAGLGFCVKDGDAFVGRRGARVGSAAGPAQPRRRLRCLVLERSALGRARQRAGARRTGRSSAASPAAATATRSSARSPTPTCPPSVEVGHGGRGRHLRRVGRRRGRARAAVRPQGRARQGYSADVIAFVTAGAGFLLSVLWFDLMFDVQVLSHAELDLPEERLASIAAYYGRVTTAARPMNRLIAAVMLGTLAAIIVEIVKGAVPRWVGLGLARPRRGADPARRCAHGAQRGAPRRARRYDRSPERPRQIDLPRAPHLLRVDRGPAGAAAVCLSAQPSTRGRAGAEGGGTTGPISPSGASSRSTITGA